MSPPYSRPVAPVIELILNKVRVQEVDRYLGAVDPPYAVDPCRHGNEAAFQLYTHPLVHSLQVSLRVPVDNCFCLAAILGQVLFEVTLSKEKRNSDHRGAQVSGGSQRVACQDPQATAIGRHLGIESDLHREVGYASISRHKSSAYQTKRPHRFFVRNTVLGASPHDDSRLIGFC
jgi:hypothetical protein